MSRPEPIEQAEGNEPYIFSSGLFAKHETAIRDLYDKGILKTPRQRMIEEKARLSALRWEKFFGFVKTLTQGRFVLFKKPSGRLGVSCGFTRRHDASGKLNK